MKTSGKQNAYLTALCSEKVHTTLGTEGENKGKTAIMVRALYGLESSGASGTILQIVCVGHKSCLADPDLWYKPEVRQEDKFKYYSYVLLYVDDCLCIHHSAEEELNRIDKFFKMKAGSIEAPDIYLGAKVKPLKMNNGGIACVISPTKYVNEAINNCE